MRIAVVKPAVTWSAIGASTGEAPSSYRRDVLGAISRVAAAVNYDIPTSDGGTQKILRALVAFNDESAMSQRLPSNRTNQYPLPGALARIAAGTGLQAIHCRNVDNPQTVPVIGQPSPPCQVAPQLRFRGRCAPTRTSSSRVPRSYRRKTGWSAGSGSALK